MRDWLLKIFLPLEWQMKEWVTALFCRNMPGSVERHAFLTGKFPVSLDLQVCNLLVEYKRYAGLTKTDVRNWFAHAIQAARAVLLMSVSMWKSTVTSTFNINLVAFFSNSASMPKPRITEIPLINLNIIFVKKKSDQCEGSSWHCAEKHVAQTNSAAQADSSFNTAYDLSQYNTTIFMTQQSPME